MKSKSKNIPTQEKSIRALQAVSGVGSAGIALWSSPALIVGVGILLIAIFATLAFFNYKLFRSISSQTLDRKKYSLYVMIIGLISTVTASLAIPVMASLSSLSDVQTSATASNTDPIIWQSAVVITIIVGIAGSLWPYLYFRRLGDKV